MDHRVPAWELAVVSGPPGAELTDTIARCLAGVPRPVVTATVVDHPLLAYGTFPAGPGPTVVAELVWESEEGYRAVERLLAAGTCVLVVTRDRWFQLWPRFRDYRTVEIPVGWPDDVVDSEIIDDWATETPRSTAPNEPADRGYGAAPPARWPVQDEPPPPHRPGTIGALPADEAPVPRGSGSWGSPAAKRVVNVAVADGGGRPATGGVPPGLPYLVRVGIGRARPDSILPAGLPEFPTRLLPDTPGGWWLEAVLCRDGVPVANGALFLPRTGEGFACPCTPDGPHVCTQGDRSPWLQLAAVAPRTGIERLQLHLYLGAAAVQAFDLDVPVGGNAPPVARTVFTLSKDLAELSRFGDRTISIREGDLPSGRHYLVVNGTGSTRVGSSISDGQAGTAARSLRAVLFDRQLRKAEGGWTSLYDKNFGKPQDAYLADLRAMARAGATAHLALFPRPGDRAELAAALTASEGPGVIQVALAEGSRAVVPWQLVYDLPILEGAAVCPGALEFGPGSPAVVVPARCPHVAGHRQPLGVLCPFGFWGLAHVLEVPPSSGTMTLAEATGTDRPPAVVAGLHESLRGADWDGQRAALDRLGAGSVVTTTVTALQEAVEHGADLLYLYCHGRRATGAGTAPGSVVLDFGAGGTLTPEHVSWWPDLAPRIRWQRRRPLVVLNGCHTGERLPETLIDFASAFVQSPGAAGVLATEVTMEQGLAAHAMSAFVTAWGSGLGVGEALRRMRWQLLARGNVMGLAYSPYCDADLRLP